MDAILQFLKANPLLVIILALAGAWFYLRTSSSDIASIDEFGKAVRSGRPVLVQLYSNT